MAYVTVSNGRNIFATDPANGDNVSMSTNKDDLVTAVMSLSGALTTAKAMATALGADWQDALNAATASASSGMASSGTDNSSSGGTVTSGGAVTSGGTVNS